MQPIIKELKAKKLVGTRMAMSLTDNRTHALWGRFMPRRREIKNVAGPALFSLQTYPPGYFENFDRRNVFEKWALLEVAGFDDVPDGMEPFLLEGGLYATFLHRGPASEGVKTFRRIFSDWLPAAAYELDGRPHFELLDERYKNEDPDSEEEIWIPVRFK